MRGTVIDRKRCNQPQGYQLGKHHNIPPVTHFCLRHNYLYYPFDWTDEATGRNFRKGYYDENGQYYENVSFYEDGTYKNVVCRCEYCDTVTKIDWTEGGPLICPQCGGTMKILSALDEYTQDPCFYQAARQPGYVDIADQNQSSAAPYRSYPVSNPSHRSALIVWLSVAIILSIAFTVMICFLLLRYRKPSPWILSPTETVGQSLINPDLFGSTLYLQKNASGTYSISNAADSDKRLVWDSGEESYYDDASELWLWYNTDVEPPIWQYWYEPISGDYGDYGWMEYENGTWYIEVANGKWEPVPTRYDTAALWHIEPDESGRPSEDLPIVPAPT